MTDVKLGDGRVIRVQDGLGGAAPPAPPVPAPLTPLPAPEQVYSVDGAFTEQAAAPQPSLGPAQPTPEMQAALRQAYEAGRADGIASVETFDGEDIDEAYAEGVEVGRADMLERQGKLIDAAFEQGVSEEQDRVRRVLQDAIDADANALNRHTETLVHGVSSTAKRKWWQR